MNSICHWIHSYLPVYKLKAFEKHTKVDDRLDFVNADLMKDAGWSDAVNGCLYVLHVASPFPSQPPKHEDDLIVPAREGTLRILKAHFHYR